MQLGEVGVHLSELFGLFEAIGTAIRRILAIEIEVATSLARCIAIAFDLPPLALVAEYSRSVLDVVIVGLLHRMRRNIQTSYTTQAEERTTQWRYIYSSSP
tara:strand:+ start:211 stop:513 length:303 start_codon:yes stop_codon:yes gene_type:complete